MVTRLKNVTNISCKTQELNTNILLNDIKIAIAVNVAHADNKYPYLLKYIKKALNMINPKK